MKILITGIAGLLGSHLARYIAQETDHEVVGIDDLSCGMRDNIPAGVRWHERRIAGYASCAHLFELEQPDIVYHFAAYAAECLSPFIRCYNYDNNLLATSEVVNACLNYRVGKLVFASSMAVYGQQSAPFSEIQDCRPIDSYGIAKAACEQDIQVAGRQHGLQWCIVRPHNVYGPGQVCTQVYRNVFGIWMWRHLRGLPLRIYGDGTQQRAFSYIQDIVRPLLRAGVDDGTNGHIINLGGTQLASINEAANTLKDVIGEGVSLEYHESRLEVHTAWCTNQKAVDLLGYADTTSLQDGLQAMWKWASQAEHWPVYQPQIEVEQGLPGYWRKGQ